MIFCFPSLESKLFFFCVYSVFWAIKFQKMPTFDLKYIYIYTLEIKNMLFSTF